MKTNWNPELDEALFRSVDRLTKAGFNRLERDPKRDVRGNWAIGWFWRAVAAGVVVQCCLGTESPSPEACKKRWWDVLDRMTDPNVPESRIKIEPGISAELKKYDDEYLTDDRLNNDERNEVIKDALDMIQTMKESAEYAKKALLELAHPEG